MKSSEDRDWIARLDLILVVVFYILAVLCVVAFFLYREENRTIFIGLGIAALVVRAGSYALRLIKH